MASFYVKRSNESTTSFIEPFFLPAQANINLTSSVETSAAKQNFSMMMVTNANLSAETFTNVMTSFVLSTSDKGRTASLLHITSTHLPSLMSVRENHISGDLGDESKAGRIKMSDAIH